MSEAIKRAPTPAMLEIVTDSQNVIGWVMGRFKRNNPDVAALCRVIDNLQQQREALHGGAVSIHKVLGHSGQELNERADELARAAVKRRQ